LEEGIFKSHISMLPRTKVLSFPVVKKKNNHSFPQFSHKQPFAGEKKGTTTHAGQSEPWAQSTLQAAPGCSKSELRSRLGKPGGGREIPRVVYEVEKPPSAAGQIENLSKKENHGEQFLNATQETFSDLLELVNKYVHFPHLLPTPTLHLGILKVLEVKLLLPRCPFLF
jgi:hypothetical protein